MIGTPPEAYNNDDWLTPCISSALREMLGNHPRLTAYSVETLAELLWSLRYLPRRPEGCEVEAALETLRVEGEVLA